MIPSSKPIPNSYWVIPDQFLAGEHPSAKDEAQARSRLLTFLEAGFDTFIDLTEGERPDYRKLLEETARRCKTKASYHNFPFPDFGVPSPFTMINVLNAIDKALAGGHKVYLHCAGGIGRTGTAVGCYLVRHGRNGPQALAELGRIYRTAAQSTFSPNSPEDSRQIAFIRDWRG